MTSEFDQTYYEDVTGTEEIRRFGPHWWSNRFFARRLSRCLRRTGGSRCLELGCAHGHILRFLGDEFEVYGVDISEHAITRSRLIAPGARTMVADIRTDLEFMFSAASFDAILAKSVFEHLEHPAEVIKSCHRLLRPAGTLLFSVPSTTNILRGLKGDNWIGVRDPSHVSVLKPHEWESLLTDARFSIRRSYSTGFWDVPYLPVIPRALQLPLFASTSALVLLTDGAFLPARFGENLIIEAVRD